MQKSDIFEAEGGRLKFDHIKWVIISNSDRTKRSLTVQLYQRHQFDQQKHCLMILQQHQQHQQHQQPQQQQQ
jgi:hypothetical protein